jgi:hypothetical protein
VNEETYKAGEYSECVGFIKAYSNQYNNLIARYKQMFIRGHSKEKEIDLEYQIKDTIMEIKQWYKHLYNYLAMKQRMAELDREEDENNMKILGEDLESPSLSQETITTSIINTLCMPTPSISDVVKVTSNSDIVILDEFPEDIITKALITKIVFTDKWEKAVDENIQFLPISLEPRHFVVPKYDPIDRRETAITYWNEAVDYFYNCDSTSDESWLVYNRLTHMADQIRLL